MREIKISHSNKYRMQRGKSRSMDGKSSYSNDKDGEAIYSESESKKSTGSKEAVDRWVNWSLTKHTTEEIKQKILTDFDSVCFTYVCETSVIPSSFLEELVVLSTGLLTEDNYEIDFDLIKNVLFANLGIDGYTYKDKELKIHSGSATYSVQASLVRDRIDWISIGCNQQIDLYTAERFGKFLPWDKMSPEKNGLSKSYIEACKQQYLDAKYGREAREVKKNNNDYDDSYDRDIEDSISDFEDDFV